MSDRPSPVREAQQVYCAQLLARLSDPAPLLHIALRFSERRMAGLGPQRARRLTRLGDLNDAVQRHPAFVLRGEPGSGKTTALAYLARKAAEAFISGAGQRLPLLLNLKDFTETQTSPLDFVQARCRAELGQDFVALAQEGRVLLLLDGLDESPLEDQPDLRASHMWQEFLRLYFAGAQSSRAVIASRDSAGLLPDLPQVEIEPLDDNQIAAYLQATMPDKTERALADLRRAGWLDQVRLPFWLEVFVQTYDPADGLPANRTLLLSQYTQQSAGHLNHRLIEDLTDAQGLLARWQSGDDLTGLWRAAPTRDEMPEVKLDVSEGLLLTRWQEITLASASLAAEPDAFVEAVRRANPALAGRCLVGGAAVSGPARHSVQQALLTNLSDAALPRRARIQAGRVLGKVGDPRFTPVSLGGVPVILPDLVEVRGGTAQIGAERWPFDRHAPPWIRDAHAVEIDTFWLGKYPVTNAEYRCFLEAGGYAQDEHWTAAGRRWRRGELPGSEPVEEALEMRRHLLKNPGEIECRLAQGRLLPEVAAGWQAIVAMPETEVREYVLLTYPAGPRTQPAYWNDPAYNAPNQPVVGVTWYEALAYCRWLQGLMETQAEPSLPDGHVVRLPSEAEWEWAAGGPAHSLFAWGDEFDPDRANTLEGRVLGPTPVGAYPQGQAACGALDLSGNVWEWCHSLYRPYPYRRDDGREDPSAEGRRILRGGSWFNYQRGACVIDRKFDRTVYATTNAGFRIAIAAPL